MYNVAIGLSPMTVLSLHNHRDTDAFQRRGEAVSDSLSGYSTYLKRTAACGVATVAYTAQPNVLSQII